MIGRKATGITLVELLITIVVAAFILLGLTNVVSQISFLDTQTDEELRLVAAARTAMERIQISVKGTSKLVLPMPDNPNTAQNEAQHTVLAVALDHSIDFDADGWSDANNDKDFVDSNGNSIRDAGEPERIDEDMGKDMNFDGQPGILGIDDDNDGNIDENSNDDDDEDNDNGGGTNEELLNRVDDDGDGTIDEDLHDDMNQDGAAGLIGVDDDGDSVTDEGDNRDDDEDGLTDEDWLDTVAFFLSGTKLKERRPTPSGLDGTAYSEITIADNVSEFTVERLVSSSDSFALVKISLTITLPSGASYQLQAQLSAPVG